MKYVLATFSMGFLFWSGPLAADTGTFVQRCISGEDMYQNIDHLSGRVLSQSPAKSMRATLVSGASDTTFKFEYYLDKDCSQPYLTYEVFYQDQLASHLRMRSLVRCQSPEAIQEYEGWAKYWKDSPRHQWDGTNFSENVSDLPAEERTVFIRRKSNSTPTAWVIRVRGGGNLIPLFDDIENEAFQRVP